MPSNSKSDYKQTGQPSSSRYDEFLNFLDNAEQEFSQVQTSTRSVVAQSHHSGNLDTSALSIQNPDSKEAFTRVRERLIELEIEKEEQSKALEILKQLRVKEK